jgi:hypothetical protein
VDLSPLIFVALAVAWAAYLIPKALSHHDDVERGRSIERFSHGMRVLARREPVSARKARLVETPTRATTRDSRPTPTPATPSPDQQYAVRRASVQRATRRRRRVLAVLALAIAGTLAVAASGRLGWSYAAAPVFLLLAWLVACRLMVRREHAWQPVVETDTGATGQPASDVVAASPAEASVEAHDVPEERDSKLWDPVPVTLPTYVSKPPARRAVRTIDLDATGVWTSGRTESDAALAREADAAETAERVRRRATRKDEAGGEAVGS